MEDLGRQEWEAAVPEDNDILYDAGVEVGVGVVVVGACVGIPSTSDLARGPQEGIDAKTSTI